jgi:hypothetical protein
MSEDTRHDVRLILAGIMTAAIGMFVGWLLLSPFQRLSSLEMGFQELRVDVSSQKVSSDSLKETVKENHDEEMQGIRDLNWQANRNAQRASAEASGNAMKASKSRDVQFAASTTLTKSVGSSVAAEVEKSQSKKKK